MTAYRKKLIEVALPLDAINRGCQQEKNPFIQGHPRNLHLWWARRPLAACRAVLFSSLVNDPGDDPMYGLSEDIAATERAKLFNLIEELVKWENSNNPRVINAARLEIARSIAANKVADGELEDDTPLVANTSELPEEQEKYLPDPPPEYTAHDVRFKMPGLKPEQVNHFLTHYAPPVLDPFCGGGSIPLEAQRLGLRAHASDLNPVPVLITKALIEIPPKFAGMPPVNPEACGAGVPPAGGKRNRARQRPAPQLMVWPGAKGLAEDVRYYGQWMRDEAQKRIGHLYPKVKITQAMVDDERPDLEPYKDQELTVIAWLWARTVPSSNPAYSGIRVPLVKSLWLSKKRGKEAWLEPVIDQESKSYTFRVRLGTPNAEQKDSIEAGTKLGRGCKFRCILSDTPIPEEHIKSAGMEGKLSQTLIAVVCKGARGRVYLSPTEEIEAVTEIKKPEADGIESPIANDKRALWCLLYGLTSFDKLFTPRQLTALTTFSDLVKEAREQVRRDAEAAWEACGAAFQASNATNEASSEANQGPFVGGEAAPDANQPGHAGKTPPLQTPLAKGGTGPQAYADAVATYLAFGVAQLSRYASTICGWNQTNQNVAQVFGRQALPMVWDFAEGNTIVGVLAITSTIDWVARSLQELPCASTGSSIQLDAAATLKLAALPIIATDPPYYDNIGYADLSDFFYVWLRRSLRDVYPDLLSTMLTPKAEELIASPYRHDGDKKKAAEFFEIGLRRAIQNWREQGHPDYPTTIFYAFKQAETDSSGTASTGWETFLTGVIDQDFCITGTWPIRTERTKGLKGSVNVLASSVVLVCVPRSDDAPLATRREFLGALKRELPDALRHLQSGSIAPVDLAQATIGPGMAIFSRYAKVMESDGTPMTVRKALTLINEVLDEVLAEQEGEFDAETRWALAWFDQYGNQEAAFGDAETLSKAKGVSVGGLVEAGILAAKAGKVRLLKRDELPDNWDPMTDSRLVVWEVIQYLIRTLENDGETAAAELLRKVGSMGEIARDLAYRLYTTCERKKWAQEALAYNSLVIAWPEISKLARQIKPETETQQSFLEE